MEAFILFLVVAVIIIYNLTKSNEIRPPATHLPNQLGGRGNQLGGRDKSFQAILKIEHETLEDGYSFDMFSVAIMGTIDVIYQDTQFELLFYERDKNNKLLPIYSSLDDFHALDTTVSLRKKLKLPYLNNILAKPIQIFPAIPIPLLSFSKKGLLNLECEITVRTKGIYSHLPNDYSLAACKTVAKLKYNNKETGYFDAKEERKKAHITAVQLAVILSRFDGDAEHREAELIKNHTSKIVDRAQESEREELKQRFKAAIQKAFSVYVCPGKFDIAMTNYIDYLCASVYECSLANKMEIITLLLDLVAIDGIAKKTEIDMMEYIVKKLEVDYEQYKKLRDKILDLKIYETDQGSLTIDAKCLLGIDESMQPDEIKSILNKEYRKWNSLQHSSDESTREQAIGMIKLIAEERKKLKTSKR